MRIFTKGVIPALIGLGLSVASAPASFADPNRYIPVRDQRAAILDCRYEMGLRGAARFAAEWPEVPPGGQTVSWIVPGPNLSPAQTDRVNECADKRLGRNPTPRFASGQQQTVERRYSRCPKHAAILYGGSGVCVKGH